MKKEIIARFCYYSGISWICFFISRLLYGNHIRVVNYHGTPKSMANQFRNQLKWYSRWYGNVDLQGLRSFMNGSGSKRSKPGLIISFDDGKRNNYDVAVPLLEEYGFTGWFFLPVGWVISSVDDQRNKWQKGVDDLLEEYPNDRVIISKEEVVKLMANHVIGSHTYTHHRMNESDSPEDLNLEISIAQQELEKLSGLDYKIFCWVGGELKHYTRKASVCIANAGFEFAFTTNTYPILKGENRYKLERSNIECDYSKELVLFQLSGLMDLMYVRKRNKLKPVFANL